MPKYNCSCQKSKLPNSQILTQLLQRFTQQELADIYGVNKKTIYRKLKPSNKSKQKRGIKEKITGDNLNLLLSFTDYKSQHNTLTHQEMADMLKEKGLLVSRPTVARVLKKNGRTRKKITLHYRELKINKVKQFWQIIHNLPLNNFSAIDECHFYLNEAPRYGYAPKSQRTISPAPGSKGGSYSLIIWVKNGKGVVHWELTDQKVNTKVFYDFIEKAEFLGKEGDFLVMDNASFHRAPCKRKELGLSSIEEQLSLKNSKLFSLPTHSPQLNPAELLFNTIRHNIEKSRSWTHEQLREAISKEITRLNNEDLNKYFQKSLQYNSLKLILDSVEVIIWWEKRHELRKIVTKIININVNPEINEIGRELLLGVDEMESIYENADI